MPEPTNKRELADAVKREMERHTIPRPVLTLEQAKSNSSETDANAILKEFLDAILDSIEQIPARVLARCVAESVEQATRPLTEEVALLRIAFENDWNRSNRNR